MNALEVYRFTAKKHDNAWNVYVARPLAAPIVATLLGTRITPNQVTVAGVLVFLVACAVLALEPSTAGAVVAVTVLQASYVLDCVDGMLARARGSASPVGHLLDFLADELKAVLLVAAVGVHAWRRGGIGFDGSWWQAGDARFLLVALAGACIVSSALALTTFLRRAEVTGTATTAEAHYEVAGARAAAPVGLVKRAAGGAFAFLRLLAHYPSYLLFVAAADRLDVFLPVYVALNGLSAAASTAQIILRLCRPLPIDGAVTAGGRS